MFNDYHLVSTQINLELRIRRVGIVTTLLLYTITDMLLSVSGKPIHLLQ